MQHALNYRHLYYFWVVAREGGVSKAADRLGMAVQTVSGQVRELERSLGSTLLQPAGRGLALTQAGAAAARQADLIFQLGEELPRLVKEAGRAPAVRLVVGISDTLPKLVARSLLQPVMQAPLPHLVLHEAGLDELLAQLALHRLDVVLADRPAPSQRNLRVYSHALGVSPVAWFAPRALWAAARKGFPLSLRTVPVVLPTSHAALRPALDLWFERHGIVPRIAAEIEDSALLKTFAAAGLGAFAAPEWVAGSLSAQYRARRIGDCEGVEEAFYAIGTERKVMHPLVRRLLAGAPVAAARLGAKPTGARRGRG